jgi:outer membrane lipoprotein-sorting protein
MKRSDLCIASAMLLLLNIHALAQVPNTPMHDVAAFKTRLNTMTEGLNTIESNFVQEKKLSVLSKMIVSKGSFYFKKENLIRWEYTQPFHYLIIINKDKIYIQEDKEHKQYDMRSNQMFREMNTFISGCIQGDILKKEKEYRMAYFEDSDNYIVTLVPFSEKMRQMLNEVQIWFDRSDLTVNRIQMVEPGGDYTKIDFTDKKLNTDIPLEKFDFK